MTILWLGAGDLAERTQAVWPAGSIVGFKRNPEGWRARGFLAEACDLLNPASVAAALARYPDYTAVVITLTPAERSEQGYQQLFVEALGAVLPQLKQVPLLFVSSTSVYAQDAGEVVDEQSEASGLGFSGRAVRAAEQLVAQHMQQYCLLRFSGIYGRMGRLKMLADVREGRCDLAKAGHWTNRIHANDCARAITFVLTQWLKSEPVPKIILASDPQPVTQGELWQGLAQLLDVPAPCTDADIARAAVTGKRCDSSLLRQMGFRFQYADYLAGYRTLVQR